jgi:HEAT repeat protein
VTRALADAVATLAALAGLLVTAIIGIRRAAIRRQRQHWRLRPPAELSLARYLAGGPEPTVAGKTARAVLLDVALAALADLRGGERVSLASFLAQLGYVDQAISQLGSRRRTVRRRAAETLATIASPAALPALAVNLADRDVLVRTACARALAELGRAEAVPAIVAAALRDALLAPGADAAVVLALGANRPAALAPLLGPGTRWKLRTMAIMVTGGLRLSQHAPLLRACLHDTDDLAAHAAHGLGRIGDADAVTELAGLALDDGRALYARTAAATALGQIGHPLGVSVLDRMLQATEWPLLAEATQALGRLGEAGALALNHAASSDRAEVRALAAAALRP